MIAAGNLNRCPECTGTITDHDRHGCELPDGQRYHLFHLPEPVRTLIAGDRDRWDELVADFDRYAELGGRFGFVTWAKRYAHPVPVMAVTPGLACAVLIGACMWAVGIAGAVAVLS